MSKLESNLEHLQLDIPSWTLTPSPPPNSDLVRNIRQLDSNFHPYNDLAYANAARSVNSRTSVMADYSGNGPGVHLLHSMIFVGAACLQLNMCSQVVALTSKLWQPDIARVFTSLVGRPVVEGKSKDLRDASVTVTGIWDSQLTKLFANPEECCVLVFNDAHTTAHRKGLRQIVGDLLPKAHTTFMSLSAAQAMYDKTV